MKKKIPLKQLKEESVILGHLLVDPSRVWTKRELIALTGKNERQVRAELEQIAFYYPIRATAGRKGYSLIQFGENATVEELEKVNEEAYLQVVELENRIRSLKSRMRPLIAIMRTTSSLIHEKK